MKIDVKQIEYNSCDYKAMLILRDNILRKPLQLKFDINDKKEDILIGAFIDGCIKGCCVLTPINSTIIKLRQMAVVENLQGKGVGKAVVQFAEKIAKEEGYATILMHSRSTATKFYNKLGYNIDGGEFMEVNIPHYLMQKNI